MIEPLGDRIIVSVVEAATRTSGGLFIPDVAQDKPMLGDVVAVGPGDPALVKPLQDQVAVGERVIFGRYAGTAVEWQGKELLILRVGDVMAKVPRESADDA